MNEPSVNDTGRCATSSALSGLSAWMSEGAACMQRRRCAPSATAVWRRWCGLSRGTIGRGLKDLDHAPLPRGRVRRDGGGRHPLSITDPTLLEDLRQLIEPVTLGDPMRPLLWVSKSHKKLAAALRAQGHTISPNTVRKLLHQLGYSRQANRKTAASMPAVTPSSSTSMPRSAPFRPTISR